MGGSRSSVLGSALLVVMVLLAGAEAMTDSGEFQRIVTFRDAMLARPGQQNWAKALASWTCPTPGDNSVGSSCDPCGSRVWGNWDHIACRGAPITITKDTVPGSGFVTNVHITDYRVEGPVPLKELCAFKSLREFDMDGGSLTGSIPSGFADCYTKLREIDLSYNQLSGTVPPEISQVDTLQQFKVEVNDISGGIPAELASLPKINWLRFSKNKMSGGVPASLAATAPHLYQLTLDSNNFEGNLYAVAQHSFVSFSADNNPKLCGMVPVGARFGHGFSYFNTKLGVPCPDEAANGLDS